MDRNSFLQGIAVGCGLRGVSAGARARREVLTFDPTNYNAALGLGNVAFINGEFVQQGINKLKRSTDGVNWTQTASGFAFGAGLRMSWGELGYLYVAGSNYTLSPDLVTWTNGTFSDYLANASVCCGDRYYVVGQYWDDPNSERGSVIKLASGVPYMLTGIFAGVTPHDWKDICIGNGTMCIVGCGDSDGDTSGNGYTLARGAMQIAAQWVQSTVPNAKFSRVCWGKDRFLALAEGSFLPPLGETGTNGGSGIVQSSDGVNWQKQRMPINVPTMQYKALTYAHGTWLVAGYDAAYSNTVYLFYSYDGETWNFFETNKVGTVLGIAYGNNVVVVENLMGNYGAIPIKTRTMTI